MKTAARRSVSAPGCSELTLLRRYREVRAATVALCAPLTPEDMVVQSMPDASPAKWHLAHTSWFFETFVLAGALADHKVFSAPFAVLFNSYYELVGEQFQRPLRGLLTRPTVDEVHAYRAHVDAAIERLFDQHDGELPGDVAQVVELGLQHEEQHQELLLTDVLHLFGCNPLRPVYRSAPRATPSASEPPAQTWSRFDEGVREIGHSGDGFAFDNESPRHRRFLAAFELADRPVCEGEFAEFVDDDAYQRADLWLSDGWAALKERGWKAPLHWRREGGEWKRFGLYGDRPLDAARPLSHVSYYEADAFARWSGARLPTEAEWEVAAQSAGPAGALRDADAVQAELEPRLLEPHPAPLARMLGDVWEWTASSYEPYPGYRAPAGALGEYNGKFMCNQLVLRGGSCATSRTQARATYRNFFYPHQRWQFAGLRLAR